MDKNEWARSCALMAGIWHRPIGPVEEAAGLSLLCEFEKRVVDQAIAEIARSGADRIPTWAALYAQSKAIQRDFTPTLPPPDVTRDLTREELERVVRRGRELREKIAEIARSKALV